MEAVTGLSLIAIILIVLFIFIFIYFVPIGLYISALSSGVKVKIFKDLIGMRLRNISPRIIIRNLISASKAGVAVETPKLEAHYLAGGNVTTVVNALISASKANLDLGFENSLSDQPRRQPMRIQRIIAAALAVPIIVLTGAAGAWANEPIQPGPKLVIDEAAFSFEPVVDGSMVTHDFVVRNEGDAVLNIQKVKTG